jgi:DNA-binding GntR family transcriptional regulator
MHATKARTSRQKPGRSGTRGRSASQPTKAERAYRELRRRILDNELEPDGRYSEPELVAMLTLDAGAVRSALAKLADEGLIEISSRGDVRVLPLSLDELRDIFDIAVALEPMAVRDVARQDLSKAEVERLAGAIQQMDSALLRNDLLAWAKADEQFHRRLIELCGNRRMAAVLAKCHDYRHRARMQTLGARPVPVDSNRDHAAVVDAVRRRDAEAAYALHQDHLARSTHMLIRLLLDHHPNRH